MSCKFFFLILGCIIFCYSCSHPDGAGKPDICPTFSSPQKGISNISLVVELTDISGTPVLEIPELKYNKQAIFNLEWDDNTRNALSGHSILNQFYFTDGTGKYIPYSASVGVNGYTFNGKEIGCYTNDIGYREYDKLIRSGWDIMNHSNRHIDTGDATIDIISHEKDLLDLENLYYTKTAYHINCLIVPDNYIGFVPAAEKLGYLGSSSTGHHPYRLKHPPHAQVGSTSTFDDYFLQLNRDFKDDWNVQVIDEVLEKFSIMAHGSNDSVHLFYRLGTHHIETHHLSSLLTQMQQIASDKVWFTSMREWLEYRYLREHVNINGTLTGSELKVLIDYSSLPNEFRWADITLNLSGARIINVSSDKADSLSFNDQQINIFQQAAYR